jgi:uncharacterized membrane-anchored protein
MRWKIAAAWVGLQMVFFAAWAAVEQRRLAPGVGTSILVRVEPVDPRDLLRGQYLTLSYAFNRAQQLQDTGLAAPEGSDVWFVLQPAGPHHVPKAAFAARPANLQRGEVALRGRAERWRYVYGVESYFVPEGSPTPDYRQTEVRLRVGADGGARIEQVLVSGKPWP